MHNGYGIHSFTQNPTLQRQQPFNFASGVQQRAQAAQQPAQVVPYGEVISNGVEISKWTPLSVTQLLLLLYFFVFFIFFLLETQHVRFINLWVFMIAFLGIGGLLLIVQLFAYIFNQRANNLPAPDFSVMEISGYTQAPSMTYMGKSHMREIVLAIIITLFSYLVIGWLLLDFLFRFKNDDPGEGCCKATAANEPDITDPLEWRVFHGIFTLMAAISFLTTLQLLRTMFVHMYPLRAVTHIFIATKKTP